MSWKDITQASFCDVCLKWYKPHLVEAVEDVDEAEWHKTVDKRMVNICRACRKTINDQSVALETMGGKDASK